MTDEGVPELKGQPLGKDGHRLSRGHSWDSVASNLYSTTPSDGLYDVQKESTSFKEPVPQMKPKARYYSKALTDEDKKALAAGEENHNLRKWTKEDLVRYHESRVELLPWASHRAEAIATLNKAKYAIEQSHTVWNQVLRFIGHPLKRDSSSQKEAYAKQTRAQVALSIVDPLSVSSEPPKADSPSSSLSGAELQTPNRVRSSPPSAARPYQLNESLTFDNFTSPHILGKGDAYRDAENAMTSKSKEKKVKNRLGRIPSMPLLSKRTSWTQPASNQ